ncbi:MAG: hypothetical protein AB8G17_17035 [Gammaproteobacteria bacterium]
MAKSKPAITKRQRYWLNHIKAADATDGSLVEYAATHKLKVKDLYQWKTALARRGLMPSKKSEPAFVAVSPAISAALPSSCNVTLPNGVRLPFTGNLYATSLRDILTTASRLA